MAKYLVVVESPTKCRTINKFLGKNYVILSSMGHVVDLPKSKMGVDIENDFKPAYIVIAKRRKVLSELKKSAKNKSEIYLAMDPDREGEAIFWLAAFFSAFRASDSWRSCWRSSSTARSLSMSTVILFFAAPALTSSAFSLMNLISSIRYALVFRRKHRFITASISFMHEPKTHVMTTTAG